MISRSDTGRKAVYEITEAGRAELSRRQPELQALESELDDSVAQLARDVRQQVRGTARSLKAELAAAARTARREATEARPAVDAHWAASPLARDIEVSTTQLRDETRRLIRRRGVDDQLLAAVREVIESARDALRALSD